MGKTPHCDTLSSPAAKLRNAVKTRAKGCLRLGAPISFTRLPVSRSRAPAAHRKTGANARLQRASAMRSQRLKWEVPDTPYDTGGTVRSANVSRFLAFGSGLNDLVSPQPSLPLRQLRYRRQALGPIPNRSCPSGRGLHVLPCSHGRNAARSS